MSRPSLIGIRIGPVDLAADTVYIDGFQFTLGAKYTILELGWAVLLPRDPLPADWIHRVGECRPFDGEVKELGSSKGIFVTSHPVLVALAIRAWWFRNGQKQLDRSEIPSFDRAVEEVRQRKILNDFNQKHVNIVPGLGRWAADGKAENMSNANLGRLERVDLRSIWTSESGDFTPWLAQEANIELLGETIGIELEYESSETGVGPFRADILCKDMATGDWVLIENQLERTDHSHLGQLLTYAAGLQAVTIVWIAHRFTEEHRAALDWLNEITDEKFTFFGLEVELWRIGQSPVAPKFNVVCKPNDWSKRVVETAKTGSEELTDTKKLQLEYWTAFWERLDEAKSALKGTKPLPQNWTNFSLGRTDFGLHAVVNTQKPFISAGMSLFGPKAKARFGQLLAEKAAIEADFGGPLEWEPLPGKKECRIRERLYNADPTDRSQWPRQHDWLRVKLEALHKAFSNRVRNLVDQQYPAADESDQDD